MADKGTQPDIRGFWTWFADRSGEILEIIQGKREGRVTEIIDEALQRFGLNLAYDVTAGPHGGELTFTPEGDPAVARFIDGFVAAAPSFDHWLVHGRRQRKTLQAAIAFVKAIFGVDLADARFDARHVEGIYHLRIMHDGLLSLEEDQRFAAAGTFLDHALGEQITMLHIGSLDIQRSGDGIQMALMVNEIIRATGGTTADLQNMD